MADEQGGSNQQKSSQKGSPLRLSQQLGIPVQDVLGAIDYAQIDPLESESGQIEYEVKSVVAAYLEQVRQKESEQNSQLHGLLRECLEATQDSIRQMIREENRVAFQIKDMTESRFLEVLGQVSVSMGRLEAFVMQGARLLSQIDMRLSRMSDFPVQEGQPADIRSPVRPAAIAPAAKVPAATRQLSNAEHWKEFEAQITRTFAAQKQMAESAISDWLSTAKSVLNLGSLELRLNGEHQLEKLRPALIDKPFSSLHISLPVDENVLPAFENYHAWVCNERNQGHAAILLYLVLILNRGPQISWSGFVSTFVNEV